MAAVGCRENAIFDRGSNPRGSKRTKKNKKSEKKLKQSRDFELTSSWTRVRAAPSRPQHLVIEIEDMNCSLTIYSDKLQNCMFNNDFANFLGFSNFL